MWFENLSKLFVSLTRFDAETRDYSVRHCVPFDGLTIRFSSFGIDVIRSALKMPKSRHKHTRKCLKSIASRNRNEKTRRSLIHYDYPVDFSRLSTKIDATVNIADVEIKDRIFNGMFNEWTSARKKNKESFHFTF